MQIIAFVRQLLSRGGVILAGGAVISKLLGMFRDRTFTELYGSAEVTDLIYAAFRVPDFFYFLLITGTISAVLIPRAADVSADQHGAYVGSFLTRIFICFGGISLIGFLFSGNLMQLFAPGFSEASQTQMASLSRLLFLSTFLHSLSSVFAAYLQLRERFLIIAMAPIIYMLSLILGLQLTSPEAISFVGYFAILGASVQLILTGGAYLFLNKKVSIGWASPPGAWIGFWKDFIARVFTAGVVQLIHVADLIIISFLLAGSLTAFTYGTALGQLLLTIIGISFANGVFPALSRSKNDPEKQSKIVHKTLLLIFLCTLPYVAVSLIWAEEILAFIYTQNIQEIMPWAAGVYRITVLSLPFACAIPLLSRWFLANDNTRMPLKISTIAAGLSLTCAALLALVFLAPEWAVLGLGVGNFVTNVALAVGLFMVGQKQYARSK